MEPHRAIALAEAEEILGIKASLIYKLMKSDRKFPKGLKTGNARRWIASDLIKWLESKRER